MWLVAVLKRVDLSRAGGRRDDRRRVRDRQKWGWWKRAQIAQDAARPRGRESGGKSHGRGVESARDRGDGSRPCGMLSGAAGDRREGMRRGVKPSEMRVVEKGAIRPGAPVIRGDAVRQGGTSRGRKSGWEEAVSGSRWRMRGHTGAVRGSCRGRNEEHRCFSPVCEVRCAEAF